MSRLFRRPSSKGVHRRQDDEDPNSAFSSLLNPVTTIHRTAAPEQPEKPSRRRSKSSPVLLSTSSTATADIQSPSLSSRPWLNLVVAERQTSWTGERPPTRKLVKDPGSGGSARPSFSHELSNQADESDGKEDGKERGGAGLVRRGVERIRELYRREKG
ncbi:hypothetical protein NKR19_g6057 [Coniochaeta hoffmannii]|uniref:Uncharacterized protein n=1 Tax=Coniochaeta hoffmannii TaxID=91930 RepID=A0AA38RUC7_9PEZI|nr:hypothetical protein NKR19_g6057 [Coniochaeta hoffmannii]